MKKLIYILVVMQLIFVACSNDASDADFDADSFGAFLKEWNMASYENICESVEDAFLFPAEWSREDLDDFANLPDEFFCQMSTCGLVETLLNHPHYMGSPWFATAYYSDFYLPGVTIFNENLRANKVAVELFARDDYFLVLASKYLTFLEVKRSEMNELVPVASVEMLLASDMCMTVLNERGKDQLTQLMMMALERMKYEKVYVEETRHIMAAVMRTCNYIPFLNEVGTEWAETQRGYQICYYNVVEEYARRFLNDKN